MITSQNPIKNGRRYGQINKFKNEKVDICTVQKIPKGEKKIPA